MPRPRSLASSHSLHLTRVVAHYALEGLPNQVLAAEYRTVLPKEPTLVAEIEKTIHAIETRRAAKHSTKRKTRLR